MSNRPMHWPKVVEVSFDGERSALLGGDGLHDWMPVAEAPAWDHLPKETQ